jgi:hypothetical protein
VRLRLVLPRRRRGTSLSGLTDPARGALFAAALLVAGVLAGCGGSGDDFRPGPEPPSLEIGVLEGNPHLLAPGAVPAEFAPSRDRLAELRPRYVRVLIDWEKIQPQPDAAPRFDVPSDGCMRGVPPCAPHSGVRDVLRALAARRAAGERGWEPVVVIYGTPAWAVRQPAAETPRGDECGLSSRAREPDPAAYTALIRALRAEARADGAPLRWWAPWNEPNHPAFLAPQRARCDDASPSTSAARYARIVDALRAVQEPGERILLGDTAGYDAPRPSASSVTEFIDGLPRRTVCSSAVWAQHVYVAQPGGPDGAAEQGGAPLAGDADAAGSPALLRAVRAALDRHSCPNRHHLWLTETGVGGPRPGRDRPTDRASLRRACRAMAAALESWRRDPRVDVAFQYSFREDPAFPVGLADAQVNRVYAPYAAWRAAAVAPAGLDQAVEACPSP